MEINTILLTSIFFFFLSSFVNVILQTMKSILTIKGSILTAAVINSIAFGFYAIVVKLTANNELYITIPLTMIANFFGVYIAMKVLKKTGKDKTWKISCTITKENGIEIVDLITFFKDNSLDYNIIELYEMFYHKYQVDIFSKNQEESILIKELIQKYNIKYTVYELEKFL